MSHDLSSVTWRKSRRSHQQGECVEIAEVAGVVAVRDSMDPEGPMVVVPRAVFCGLARAIRNDRHDL